MAKRSLALTPTQSVLRVSQSVLVFLVGCQGGIQDASELEGTFWTNQCQRAADAFVVSLEDLAF
jgi:hypothetical protein